MKLSKERHSPAIFNLSKMATDNLIGRFWRNSLVICTGLSYLTFFRLLGPMCLCASLPPACLQSKMNGTQIFASPAGIFSVNVIILPLSYAVNVSVCVSVGVYVYVQGRCGDLVCLFNAHCLFPSGS